jgi:chemotaxis receptor (MCP) glutamine deamidase CheD
MLSSIYLNPGELVVCRDATEITTILGSCVSVALFDTTLKIGGLCHYLLPCPLEHQSQEIIGKFGELAIPALVEALIKMGGNEKSIQAKIYGGANVLWNLDLGKNVGIGNIKTAHDILQRMRIPIIEEQTGGVVGRKISLLTSTFVVNCEELHVKQK